MAKTIMTRWEIRTFDVWGNAKDGYEVNDAFVVERGRPVRLRIQVCNPDTPQQFETAYPSDYQIQRIFGTSAQIDTDGDDLSIHVTRASDGYPIGSMYCVSHESLSPIRERIAVQEEA